MGSNGEYRCAECGSEVVDSSSRRGFKFCPECERPRNERDVDVIGGDDDASDTEDEPDEIEEQEDLVAECSCCTEEIDQSDEAEAEREQLYEGRVEGFREDREDPESFGEALLEGNTARAHNMGLSPDEMCRNCLKAGCTMLDSVCVYRRETTDPSECDHSFFPTPFGPYEKECRYCRYHQ